MATFVWSGAIFGELIGMGVAAPLIDRFGWPMLFYSFGSLGFVWFAAWVFFGASTPERSRWLSQAERDEIAQLQVQTLVDDACDDVPSPVPWVQILSSPPVWAIVLSSFSFNWFSYIAFTWMPQYLESLGLTLETSGFLSALPYLVNAGVMLLGAQAGDAMITRQKASTSTVRKVLNSLGMLLPAACLTVLSLWRTIPQWVAISLMVASVGLGGFAACGYGVNHLDISPKYAGILIALSNTIATIPGIVGVSLTGKQIFPLFFVVQHLPSFWVRAHALYVVGFLQGGFYKTQGLGPWCSFLR
jgi:cyanate permease